jgi:hypothetical protein
MGVKIWTIRPVGEARKPCENHRPAFPQSFLKCQRRIFAPEKNSAFYLRFIPIRFDATQIQALNDKVPQLVVFLQKVLQRIDFVNFANGGIRTINLKNRVKKHFAQSTRRT